MDKKEPYKASLSGWSLGLCSIVWSMAAFAKPESFLVFGAIIFAVAAIGVGGFGAWQHYRWRTRPRSTTTLTMANEPKINAGDIVKIDGVAWKVVYASTNVITVEKHAD